MTSYIHVQIHIVSYADTNQEMVAFRVKYQQECRHLTQIHEIKVNGVPVLSRCSEARRYTHRYQAHNTTDLSHSRPHITANIKLVLRNFILSRIIMFFLTHGNILTCSKAL